MFLLLHIDGSEHRWFHDDRFGSLYWFFFLAFAQRAWAARRATSLRCSGVIF